MILAGIDIGTNTLRLIVADVGPNSFHELYADRKITRLGQDLESTGMLGRAAEDLSLQVLDDFSQKIRRYAAFKVAAVGTSALRNASNGADFIAAVKRQTGIEIMVLSGEEEARLALLGVTNAFKGLKNQTGDLLDSAFVADIGGGSTEIIMTRPVDGPNVVSLPLGAVYLTDRYIKTDPPTIAELDRLRRTVREVLELHGSELKPGPGPVFIGTAGTSTTLAAMDLKLEEYDPDSINGHIVTIETVNGIIQRLSESALEVRRSMQGLERGREDIILAGAIVVQELMQRFGFTGMLVSDWGLREGLVIDLYEKLIKDR